MSAGSPSPAPPGPASASAPANSAGPTLYRVGTLSYTGRGLAALFGWLLTADVVLSMIERVEAKILPIILKAQQATDTQIAIIVSSIPAILQLVVAPVVSYRSDRTRSPRGRRIPYIIWATPIMSVMLFATPYAPEIAAWLVGYERVAGWLAVVPWAPTILMFAMLTIGFRFGHIVLVTMFFALFRDVVPSSHMGRFLGLFRAVGAFSTFATAYWLLGIAVSHAREIFLGLGGLNLLGFFAICAFVREGEYPPVQDRIEARNEGAIGNAIRVCRNFVKESYSHPIYWWTYLTRLPIFASVPISGFIVFFPPQDLGIDLATTGKYMSWPAAAWILAAYPVGRMFDRFGTIRMLIPALGLSALSYGLSFFMVVGPISFFISSFATGLLFWVLMLGQIALAQEIFHQERYAQLSSASIIIHSVGIAFIFSPLAGVILHALRDYHAQFTLPLLGVVEVGSYRFVNLFMAGLYTLSFIAIFFVRRWWLKLGGAQGHYQAPL